MRIAVLLSYILFTLVNVVDAKYAKKPKLIIKERVWNFGTIKQYMRVTHNFLIRNEGQAPLIIKRLRTTCGCTAALTTKQKIAPGESGEINVTFSSGYRKGRVTKYVYVESNDPDEPLVKLTVTGIVEVVPSPHISVTPANVDLGVIWTDSKIKTILNVENTGTADLIIHGVEGPPTGDIRVRVASDTIPAGRIGKIDILYEPNIPFESIHRPIRNIRSHIIIRSNDPRRPELWVPIKVYIVDDPWLYAIYSKILTQVP
ncbi:MAG TPA: DUF1573 domain-containing protein [bacterium (Candidatus Stahlbacteria)]|nr:DUF1573 domain-containing protein [Candidatus Stahlbacteria bacterium]